MPHTCLADGSGGWVSPGRGVPSGVGVRRTTMADKVARKSPDPVAVLRGHTVDVTALAFSDTLLASGCASAREAASSLNEATRENDH